MELNRVELGILANLLQEKIEPMNNNVATMSDEEFKAMITEKDQLVALQNKVIDEIQKWYNTITEADNIFGN